MGQIQGNLAPDLVSFFYIFFGISSRLLYLGGKQENRRWSSIMCYFLPALNGICFFCYRDAEEWFSSYFLRSRSGCMLFLT